LPDLICSSIAGAMQPSQVPRAVAAAMSVASSLDLTVADAIVLPDPNKLTLRLLPDPRVSRLRSLKRVIGQAGGAEQLLHGEPHPGNVL
jgi:hypothetical protein